MKTKKPLKTRRIETEEDKYSYADKESMKRPKPSKLELIVAFLNLAPKSNIRKVPHGSGYTNRVSDLTISKIGWEKRKTVK